MRLKFGVTKLKLLYSKIVTARQVRQIRREYGISVMRPEDTVAYIKEHKCSVTRYGDGEFELMLGYGNPHFQEPSEGLAAGLLRVFENPPPQLLICVPYFIVSTKETSKDGGRFWEYWAQINQEKVVKAIRQRVGRDYLFGDSYISRPFTAYKSRKNADRLFPLLKELWDGQDVLFVEGEGTRLGVGNDLFSNTKSIKRILAPAENAFDSYQKILDTVRAHWNGELVILAVGPTATVLAHDLSQEGIQTLDLGHIDIQYEWYLSGEMYQPVTNKYVNEVTGADHFGPCQDQEYLSQIIAKVQ